MLGHQRFKFRKAFAGNGFPGNFGYLFYKLGFVKILLSVSCDTLPAVLFFIEMDKVQLVVKRRIEIHFFHFGNWPRRHAPLMGIWLFLFETIQNRAVMLRTGYVVPASRKGVPQ